VVGRRVVVAAVVLGVCVAGCSPGPAADGVLTGRAAACVGPGGMKPPARVDVFRGGRLVATEVVPGGGIYRFVLAPGRYMVSNTGVPEPGRPQQAASVAVGSTVHIDIPDLCK